MSKLMQKGSKLLAFFVALAMTSLFCLDGSFAIETNAETILSAAQIVEEMGIGWNLGNSLDSTGGSGANGITGYETAWGNPVVTEDLIKAVKAKGFNTVRVPVTWYEHITVSGSTYTIDKAWLARVKQVVDYAYNNGMYVILNIHHENWINRSDLASSYSAMSAELKQVWTQIATYFSDYDQHLIFEGMNEPRAEGTEIEWSGNSACYDVVNKLDADFISTVRSVDSPYKTTRMLMVPGYAASGDYGVYSGLDKSLFEDDYVAASVHAYKPYDFAMGDGDHSDFSSEYKAQLDGIFGDLRSFFTQDDIPVVIGEFSASNYGNTTARVEWAEYYMTLAKEIGAACVLWDNNVEANNGGEAHGYINRSNNTWYSASESVVNKLISVRNDSSIIWGSKSSYPLYSHEDFTSGKSSNGVINISEMSGFTSGTELAIKYTSDTVPILALMNSSWLGWTELSPYDFTYTDSYTIAYVKYDDIYGAWNGANGDLAYIKVIDSNYNDVSCSVMVLNVKASHTHTLADKYSSDATGHWYACSGCDEKVNFEKHTEDSGTVTKQPTETEEGEKTYKCTKCKYVIRTESITKLDHSHDLAATYSSDATGHWYACSGCDEKVNFEKHTEDSGTVTKQPTETEEGEKTYKCTKCKYVIRTESITKLDHSHDLAATYSSDATGHWYACSGCSEKINFEKHTEDSGTVTKQPTETAEGEKTYKCTKCKYVIRTEIIDPLSSSPVTVSDGAETKTFDTLTAALTAYKTSTKALTITLNKDADVKTLSLPTKAASITITGSGALNVNAASISIPANTKIDVSLNGTNTKPLAVKVSAGKTLSINGETSNIGAVSGTKTSSLNVNADMTAASLATFGEVNIASGKALTATGKITAVTTLNGKVILPTTAASAAVTTIENAEIILTDGNLAKVTVNDVTESLTVNVVNANGETVTLASGTTILYTAGKTDYTGKVTIANKTLTGLDLTAFLYTKEIKAEYAGAVTLYDGTEYKAYPNVTLPLAAMKDVTKDYVLILNEDISAAKITLPTKAKSLTIKSASSDSVKTLSLTGVTSLSARIPLTLENVRIESTKSFSLSASKDLVLDNFNSESISAVKGSSKIRLTMGETALQYVSNTKTGEISSPAVSGFGTIDLNAPFKAGKTFTTLTLDLGSAAELTVPGAKSTVSTKTLYGEEGSVIKFETGFNPVKITGTTADFVTGRIKLKADGTISESTVLFTAKTVGNGVFDVTEIQPFDATVDYTMAIISGKAYIRPIALDLDGAKYALWTDVTAAIDAAKASTADYTVTLLDDYNIGGAIKMPKAGTYNSLTITSDSNTLSFTGNVTSTGALNIVNTSLDSAKNGVSAKYTVSAGKYRFSAENVDFNLASGLSATGDVTLKNVTLNGTVKAGVLTLNGTNTIGGTVTVTELNSAESGAVLNILNNTKGVLSITKNGITAGSADITLRLVNADGSAATAEEGAIIASSFKGSYDGQLKLSTENGIFNIVLTAKGKLVLASEALNSTNALDEEGSETEEEEESSEDEDSEEDEDTSEEDGSDEEDDTSDDTSDEDNGEEGETCEGDEDTSGEDDGTGDSSDEAEGDEPVSDETEGDTSDVTIE